MHPYLQTIIAAMTPIGELRLAIPFALAKLDLTVSQAYILSVIGNLIPVIFWLLFLEGISKFLIQRSKFFKKFFDWLFARTRRKIQNQYKIYGYIALVLFVATPLPVTGAWTGTVAAYLLGISFWRALGLIALGVCIAGVIVTLASIGVISIV